MHRNSTRMKRNCKTLSIAPCGPWAPTRRRARTCRFKNLLLGGWLVLKPASPNEQYFHADLAPDEHYVPLRADLSDLQAQVARARANDAWAHEVAVRGAAFARAHLGLDAAMEYQ